MKVFKPQINDLMKEVLFEITYNNYLFLIAISNLSQERDNNAQSY